MGLFVSTTGTTVAIAELGFIIPHPTSDYDIGSQFGGASVRLAVSLTTAIRTGVLTWKKTAIGSVQPATDYDEDWLLAEETNLGLGLSDDRVVTFKDLQNLVAVSASPGFTWSRSGNTPSGTYLLNDAVPSNSAGRIVPISNGLITTVFAGNELANTFSIIVQKNVAGVFTNLATVNIVASRKQVFTLTPPVAVAFADELAIKTGTGSCKNPVVGMIIKGTL